MTNNFHTHLIFNIFKIFFFDKNLVQTSVRMYIVWWCMQVRNIFGLKDIFTAITGNDLNAFCANVYVYMHSYLSVVCKCANTHKIMYLSLHCWCVCRYINVYKISKTCTCVQDTLLHKLLCELYFMLMCLTLCEYANILLMWSTFSLLVFFFQLWYIGCASYTCN